MALPCSTGSGDPRLLRAGRGQEAPPVLLPTPAAARGGAEPSRPGPARPRLSGEEEEEGEEGEEGGRAVGER